MRKHAPLAVHHKLGIVLGLLMASMLAWTVLIQRVSVMGVFIWSLDSIWAFTGIWILMIAAMMLPSVLPAVLLFDTVASSRVRFGFRPATTSAFVVGYLALWSVMGVVFAMLSILGNSLITSFGQPIMGIALILAGTYQLTRWKSFCLTRCRSPIDLFMLHWRDGTSGAAFMGVYHSLYCVGCCWALMTTQVILGMMNLVWTALITMLIFVEKVTPMGERITRLTGLALVFTGVATALGLFPLTTATGGMYVI